MEQIRKISRVEGVVNLCMLFLLVFAIVFAFCIELPAWKVELEQLDADNSDKLSQGLELGFATLAAIIGAVGVSIIGIFVLISALVLLISKKGVKTYQGMSIMGIVAKLIAIFGVILLSAINFRTIAVVCYTAIIVFEAISIIFDIAAIVIRAKARKNIVAITEEIVDAETEDITEDTAAPQEDYKV